MSLVSILIPCYNAERWVAQAIESALAQTWPEKEILIIDDGSTDGSLSIIRGFGDRIRLETGPNRGGNAARNRLLSLARGDWLQYLDADDYLRPDKISGQMEFLSSHPETDVVYGPSIFEYWSEKEIVHHLEPIPEPHDPWRLLARWYLPQTGSPLWRRQSLLDIGGWKPDQPCCQEHELYLRLLMAGKRLTYAPASGSVYRRWSDQTVCNRDKPQVRQQRLIILGREEAHLREHNALTSDRHWAVNQGRFEIARMAWLEDHAESLDIMASVHRSDPSFIPGGVAASARYQTIYRTFGFRAAEYLAQWLRPVQKNPSV